MPLPARCIRICWRAAGHCLCRWLHLRVAAARSDERSDARAPRRAPPALRRSRAADAAAAQCTRPETHAHARAPVGRAVGFGQRAHARQGERSVSGGRLGERAVPAGGADVRVGAACVGAEDGRGERGSAGRVGAQEGPVARRRLLGQPRCRVVLPLVRCPSRHQLWRTPLLQPHAIVRCTSAPARTRRRRGARPRVAGTCRQRMGGAPKTRTHARTASRGLCGRLDTEGRADEGCGALRHSGTGSKRGSCEVDGHADSEAHVLPELRMDERMPPAELPSASAKPAAIEQRSPAATLRRSFSSAHFKEVLERTQPPAGAHATGTSTLEAG